MHLGIHYSSGITLQSPVIFHFGLGLVTMMAMVTQMACTFQSFLFFKTNNFLTSGVLWVDILPLHLNQLSSKEKSLKKSFH